MFLLFCAKSKGKDNPDDAGEDRKNWGRGECNFSEYNIINHSDF